MSTPHRGSRPSQLQYIWITLRKGFFAAGFNSCWMEQPLPPSPNPKSYAHHRSSLVIRNFSDHLGSKAQPNCQPPKKCKQPLPTSRDMLAPWVAFENVLVLFGWGTTRVSLKFRGREEAALDCLNRVAFPFPLSGMASRSLGMMKWLNM